MTRVIHKDLYDFMQDCKTSGVNVGKFLEYKNEFHPEHPIHKITIDDYAMFLFDQDKFVKSDELSAAKSLENWKTRIEYLVTTKREYKGYEVAEELVQILNDFGVIKGRI